MDLEQWLDDVNAWLRKLTNVDLGYPQGNNEIRYAAAKERVRAAGDEPLLSLELRTFYQVCDGASLPDIRNGYFIRSFADLRRGAESDDPTVIAGGPYKGPIIIFGSDGGGGLFAFRADEGDVLLLRGGQIAGRAYCDRGRNAERIAVSFDEFLLRLLSDISAFVEDTPGHTYIS